MTDYPTYSEHLRARYGTTWCVAQRMTPRLCDKGYTVALSPQRYAREHEEWARSHPAFQMVDALPEGPHKPLVLRVVLRELGARGV